MKTKTLLILSICLFLFACGEKKMSEKIIKQKTAIKTSPKIESKTEKEKDLATLPTKKVEHIHDQNCNHKSNIANQEFINMFAKAQAKRMKLAEMQPEEIRKKIQDLIALGDIEGLIKLVHQLNQIADYHNMFFIASNLVALASTDTEKQLADSCYALVSSVAFWKQNSNLNKDNKDKYENVKSLLIDNLNTTPNKINNLQMELLIPNMDLHANFLINYEKDIDSACEMFEKITTRIPKRINKICGINEWIYIRTDLCFRKTEDYDKIKLSEENINKLLEYGDKIKKGEIIRVCSPSAIEEFILKYKKYRQDNKNASSK